MDSFSCILFCNRRLLEFSSSMVQFNGKYYYLPQEMVGTPSDLMLPLIKNEGNWYISHINYTEDIKLDGFATETGTQDYGLDWLTEGLSSDIDKTKIGVKIFGTDQKTKQIEHKDYVAAKNIDKGFSYAMLFFGKEQLSFSGQYYLLKDGTTIGRSEENDIVILSNETVSRKVATITKQDGKYIIESAKQKSNFYYNNKLCKRAELECGDVVQIYDVKILMLYDQICVYGACECKLQEQNSLSLKTSKPQNKKNILFIRTPRIIPALKTYECEPQLPPPSNISKEGGMLLALAPALSMAVVMLVTLGGTIASYVSGEGNTTTLISGIMLAVSMLCGSLLWPVLTKRVQTNKEKREEAIRVNNYNDYIADMRSSVSKDIESNKKILNELMYPAPEYICELINSESDRRRLFEKTCNDSDYLHVRLGSGKLKSGFVFNVPPQGFETENDALSKLPYEMAEELSQADNMPVSIDLKANKTVGFIGRPDCVDRLVKSVFMSLCFAHSYDEVKTVFIYPQARQAQFEQFRKMHHCKTDDQSLRLIATTKDEVHRLFGNISEYLERQAQEENKTNSPYFVFFIFDHSLIEGQPFGKRLENPSEEDPFASIFVYNSISKLPKDCKIIVQSDKERSGYYSKEDNLNLFQTFLPDRLQEEQFCDFIDVVQDYKIKIMQKTAGVPERVSFLGIYKVGNIKDLNIKKRWEQSVSYKSLQAPIGIKAGGEVFSLNVHESFHGPHGLAAGMTGSGKSELLQAFILSLAINFHPDDVSFIIIDYKGGGMANAFDGMPHMAGKITNLSGSTLRRSFISIDSELKRRQSLLASAGVNNIDKYQRLYKEGRISQALPHLIIVADEFAQLKTHQPEFLRKIIDIAQIGRSLGIHLLLATQKPAGVVDDQIWGNSRFRMCLKVLEKQDSQEMIKKPDAAFIKLPGRCYVQVGYDEVYEYLQSGYSGAPYVETDVYLDDENNSLASVDSTGTPQRIAKLKAMASKDNMSQLEAIVKYLNQIAINDNIKPNLLWLDPLKETIYIEEVETQAQLNFDGKSWASKDCVLDVCAGLADYPETQEQKPFVVDFNKGSAAVYGVTQSGKTTFLQTVLTSLCLKNSPDLLNLYIFDFGARILSSFGALPHTKALHFSDDADQIAETCKQLEQIVYTRQKLFGQAGVPSFRAYNQEHKQKLPAVIVVIDNYSVVTERFLSIMGDSMVRLAREGAAYGVYLFVTGSNKSAVFYKVSDFIPNNYALKQNEPSGFREVLKTAVSTPPDEIAGRGLFVDNKTVVEFQAALIARTESEGELTKMIKQMGEIMTAAYGSAPKKAQPQPKPEQPKEQKNVHPYALTSKNECLVLQADGKQSIGLELSNFKTLLCSGFEEKDAKKLFESLINGLKTMRPIVIFDTTTTGASKGNIATFGQDCLSEGIAHLTAQTQPPIVFVQGLLSFYEIITDEDALALTDFVASKLASEGNFVLHDAVVGYNTMSLTPMLNSLTRDKKRLLFLVGDGVLNTGDSVFEEIVRAKKSLTAGGLPQLVDAQQAYAIQIAKEK